MKSTCVFYGVLLVTMALTKPVAQHHFCWLPGEPCSEARRSLEDLSSIRKRVAGNQNFCWLPGEPCSKAKLERDASPEAITSALPDEEDINKFCNHSDQPCSKLKRIANAISEAMALPETLPEPGDVNGTINHYCYGSGQPCALARRSALALAQSMPFGQTRHHHFCWLPGEPCSEAKRNVLTAAEAEADTYHDFTKRDIAYNVRSAQQYCDSEAGPCSATKRFTAAIVDVITEPQVNARALESEKERVLKERCYAEGGACDFGKRAMEELEKLMANF